MKLATITCALSTSFFLFNPISYAATAQETFTEPYNYYVDQPDFELNIDNQQQPTLPREDIANQENIEQFEPITTPQVTTEAIAKQSASVPSSSENNAIHSQVDITPEEYPSISTHTPPEWIQVSDAPTPIKNLDSSDNTTSSTKSLPEHMPSQKSPSLAPHMQDIIAHQRNSIPKQKLYKPKHSTTPKSHNTIPNSGIASDMFKRRNWYINASGGVSISPNASYHANTLHSKTDHDTGFSFSGALGYRSSHTRGPLRHLRAEAEFIYQKYDITGRNLTNQPFNGDLRSAAAMANVYYDLYNATSLTPYIGAGIGYRHISVKDEGSIFLSESDDIVPAYQILIGMTYQPIGVNNTSIHLGYRFSKNFKDLDLVSNNKLEVDTDFDSHNVEGGISMYF